MNLTKATLSAITLATAFFMSGAQASVIDTVTSKQIIGNDDVFTYTHDFTQEGFVIGKTTYLDGLLSVRLTDGAAGEGGRLNIGNQTKTILDVANSSNDKPAPAGSYYTIALNAASLADLNADGKISFTITGTSGDFYFAGSTLTATAAGDVPEPMSLGLLAIGMLGLGAARRRSAAR